MEELTGIRKKVFLDRYAFKDEKGAPIEQTPEEMWRRVAKGIAGVERKAERAEWEEKFYRVMEDFKFLPGGRILAGAGTGFDVTYYNCFVIPNPPDSRGGIMENLTQMIEIMSRGGGVGLNLSSLRPRGSRVKKVNGFSSGPINWAELYSLATKDIVQQGGSRRGALMLMIHDWHPDVEEFITVKQDLTKINGANLSVCVSDDFMQAVKKDADWDLIYPDLDDPLYDEKWNGDITDWKATGGKVTVLKTVKASYLWNMICEAAWRSAEPGLHFLDRSNKRSNTWYFEKLVATNPCGEQPLGPWAVCNLGAMNLAVYVKGGDLEQERPGTFDFESFGQDVQVAMRFLDNVIDDTHYFFKENEKVAKDIRRTGLGIMGIADAFIKMNIRYGSEESIEISKKIFKTLRDNAYNASSDIAKEKGSFPHYEKDNFLKGYHVKDLPKDIQKKIAIQGIRNAVLLTIAPTGTTSLVAGVSSGVEPVYEFEYLRRTKVGNATMYHPLYETWKKVHPNEKRPDYFVSANDLTPEDHVKIQAVAQEYIDSSISKTVNAPNNHTVDDVKRLYMMSYDMGLKGVTYMRDGSRQGVLERMPVNKAENKPIAIEAPKVKPRPMMVTGATYAINTPMGKAFVTINTNGNNEPLEVFINIGKAGSDVTAMAEALGRMVSLNLRFNAHLTPKERVKEIIHHFSGIGGSSSIGFGKQRVRSLPDAVAKVLATHFADSIESSADQTVSETNGHANGMTNGHASSFENGYSVSDTATVQQALHLDVPAKESYDFCPDCGETTLAYEEGCKKCYACGYSAC
ncbi:MAG: adenosylcobalamin-dependent ribonucleoside-diphosphate reductase [Candidatus Roizmanbacteria bacterium]|nr:adenosylcobalamin-dependent ribonucleoside-diphosphate reductase [Candidatus Roizmanbacteria bacterium]